VQTLLYDVRYALRQLRKTPGLTLLALLSLTLGVGANTAIFTVIESVLLRPLPYARSDRLVFIGPSDERPGFAPTSWLNYRDILAQSKLLEFAAGYSEDVSVVEGKDGSQSVVAPRVTVNSFSMLGVQPLLGRTFTEAEGQAAPASASCRRSTNWMPSPPTSRTATARKRLDFVPPRTRNC
jgi:putative ABC transport system permease protein